MESVSDDIARTLLAATFLVSAADKSLRPGAALAEIRTLAGHTRLRLPDAPILAGVLVAQWSGGVLLLFDATATVGAVILLAFLTPVTFVAHQFWSAPKEKRKEKLDHFLANAAIAGGLVLVALGQVA